MKFLIKTTLFLFLLFAVAGCVMTPSQIEKNYVAATERIERLEEKISEVENKNKNLESGIRVLEDSQLALASAGVTVASENVSNLSNQSPNNRELNVTSQFLDWVKSLMVKYGRTDVSLLVSQANNDLLSTDKNRQRAGTTALANFKSTSLQNEVDIEALQKTIRENDEFISNLKLQLEALNTDLKKVTDENAILANNWKRENSWTSNFLEFINPFNWFRGIFGFLQWIMIFFIIGLILKVLSVFFPQLKVINWFGRIVFYPFALLAKTIPDALRSINAIEYSKYETENGISNKTVEAIQEFKDSHPKEYQEFLKPILSKKMKHTPQIQVEIDEKLKQKGLK